MKTVAENLVKLSLGCVPFGQGGGSGQGPDSEAASSSREQIPSATGSRFFASPSKPFPVRLPLRLHLCSPTPGPAFWDSSPRPQEPCLLKLPELRAQGTTPFLPSLEKCGLSCSPQRLQAPLLEACCLPVTVICLRAFSFSGW